jgi:tRNA pseudouridine38-40 synthase
MAGVPRVRLIVAYDGAAFHGFAASSGHKSVLSELTRTVSLVARLPVELVGAGRTDAGVHAWGQVVSGDLPADLDLADLARRVNKMCAPAIAIRTAEWAEPHFDARFSATWRCYRYHVWNDPAPNPLLSTVCWHVPQPLDVLLMQAAVSALIGEHDFTSFCRKPKVPDDQPPASLVRIVHDIGWQRIDDSPMLRLQIKGSAFCHQMVRSLTATMVEVGLHRLTPADVHAILHARDRSIAGHVAPPNGLVLWEVGYDGRRWDAAPAAELHPGDD